MKTNKIYNEDNLLTMNVMPHNFVDLTVTSPPYDNLRSYNGYDFDFEKIAKELFRVTKIGGVLVWIAGDATVRGSETGTCFENALFFKKCGFNLHDTMIWKKPNPIPTQSTRYQQAFEYMFVFSKGKLKTFNPLQVPAKTAGQTFRKHRANKGAHEYNSEGFYTTNATKMADNVWEVVNSGSGTNHPAVFPEKLVSDHILTWSNPLDLIYDPFIGSGTTAAASIKSGRNWIGSEISEEYCNIANSRIVNLYGGFF